MIKILGQRMYVGRRAHRGERYLHMDAPGDVMVLARIGRYRGRRVASISVDGRDEAGVWINVRTPDCTDLRDAEVAMLAALERRGLRSWADALVGGGKC